MDPLTTSSELIAEEVELKKRSDLHLARKAWHILGVLTMTIVYWHVDLAVSLWFLAAGALLFIPLDVLRQNNKKINQFVVRFFKHLLRKSEVKNLTGNTWLIIGVTIIVLTFPKPVVTLSMLFLAVADPFASLFGILFGKRKIWGQKSLEGFLAAFVICTSISFAFLFYNQLVLDRIFTISVGLGIVGALSELIQIGRLDDNLTLPVLSSAGIFVLLQFAGAI